MRAFAIVGTVYFLRPCRARFRAQTLPRNRERWGAFPVVRSAPGALFGPLESGMRIKAGFRESLW